MAVLTAFALLVPEPVPGSPSTANQTPSTENADVTAASSPESEPNPNAEDPEAPLARRARMLEEAYHTAAATRAEHERLIGAYRAAVEFARESDSESYVDAFLLGLIRAYALAFEQVGAESYRELLVLAADEFRTRLSCRSEREADDAVQLEEARLLRARSAGAGRSWPGCPGAEPPPPPPPPEASPARDATDAKQKNPRELVLLGVGGVLASGGVAGIIVGALGKSIAQRSGRLQDPPTEEQMRFLDDDLPRRRAAWISVGSIALLAGIGMLTAGGVLLARQRRARSVSWLGVCSRLTPCVWF